MIDHTLLPKGTVKTVTVAEENKSRDRRQPRAPSISAVDISELFPIQRSQDVICPSMPDHHTPCRHFPLPFVLPSSPVHTYSRYGCMLMPRSTLGAGRCWMHVCGSALLLLIINASFCDHVLPSPHLYSMYILALFSTTSTVHGFTYLLLTDSPLPDPTREAL
jgi:hypothetical protein